jgi:hypothetical protein
MKKISVFPLRNLVHLFLTVCLFVVLLSTKPILGQGITENEKLIIMLEYEQGKFWELNSSTGERVLFFSFDPDLGQILNFIVSAEQNVMYVLEGPGCCGGITAGESRISKVDLVTGAIETIIAKRNLVAIAAVPDLNYLLVSFYAPDLESISVAARDGLIEHCMLDLRTKACSDELGLSTYNFIDWVSQDKFIGSVRADLAQGMSFVIDSENLSRFELPSYAPYWTNIPLTDEILTSIGVGAGSFSRINLDTLDESSYVVEGDYDPSVQFYPVSFSPDGQYLLFLYGYSYMVSVFLSGEITAAFPNDSEPQWLDNENLIYSYFAELGSYPGEIRRYNLVSGQVTPLIEFEERIGLVVVGSSRPSSR